MNFKAQKMVGVLLFITILFLFSTSTATEVKSDEELRKSKELKAAYPNTSKDYRGVVSIDANGGCADELYCDFGGNGLWAYESGDWTKLNAADPDWIIGFEHNDTEYLLCDFGAAGLWYWRYGVALPGQFVKISSANPDEVAFVSDYDNDGDDEVFLTFGADGLWIYDKGAATILSKLHASSPNMEDSLRSDLGTAGHEEGALDFGYDGLWTINSSGWTKINASSPRGDNTSADFNTADASEELIIDYSTIGLWAYDGSTWHMLTSSNTNDAVAVYLPGNADYELFCALADNPGLWVWDYASGYPGTWTQISTTTPQWNKGFCEPFDPNNDGWEEVAVDFGSNGLWLYDNAGSPRWTKINASNPEFMVRSNYNCDTNDTVLIVDFGVLDGLWRYNGAYGTWVKLSTFSPDGVN
jgi:hypothetical protein